jgi:ribonuclease P protein component
MNESLTPRERIRRKKDFLVLYKKGSRYRDRYFNLVYLANESSFSRVGVVVSRKVGNAVLRNKIKRWLRTLFRRNKDVFRTPLDILIIATREMGEATWTELQARYLSAVKKISQKGPSF